ncbi:hypothetical protein C8Q76DRAFT_404945 [Earliella scabrosa]|nr:hypothetical protein C8Q76DRAFT_404945 [Earliella scabrosa]
MVGLTSWSSLTHRVLIMAVGRPSPLAFKSKLPPAPWGCEISLVSIPPLRSRMPDILHPNARLIGLWLQLIATGAYFCYLPRCVRILRSKLREGVSPWLPLAFSVSRPDALSNPNEVYAALSATTSLVKNAATVALAIISDLIMVGRARIVHSWYGTATFR